MASVKVTVLTLGVFLACGANVVFLEHLIKYSPGCGDLVTFIQFLSMSTYGFVTESKFGKKQPVVPIREYLFAVFLYFGSSLSGNLAFSCNISMPIQMIFKSGSVMASMALGVILLGKRYSILKYASVAMITIGISTCLLVSAVDKESNGGEDSNTTTFLLGVFLLLVSLLTGARLGIVQEEIVKKYGKNPKEMMFYIHAMSLPFFIFFSGNIYKQAINFTQSKTYSNGYLPFEVPVVWLYLILNIITQFICVSCVTTLMTELSALAITVILTLRKFMSLVFSILYFQNQFTEYHALGSTLVFCGTLIFSEVPQRVYAKFSVVEMDVDEKEKKKSD